MIGAKILYNTLYQSTLKIRIPVIYWFTLIEKDVRCFEYHEGVEKLYKTKKPENKSPA